MKKISFNSYASSVISLLAPLLIGCSLAATLNGGIAITGVGAGAAFASMATWFVTIMQSDFLRLILMIVLIAGIVTMLMGGGMRLALMTVIGVAFMGLVAPSLIDTMSTTLPTADQLQLLLSKVAQK